MLMLLIAIFLGPQMRRALYNASGRLLNAPALPKKKRKKKKNEMKK